MKNIHSFFHLLSQKYVTMISQNFLKHIRFTGASLCLVFSLSAHGQINTFISAPDTNLFYYVSPRGSVTFKQDENLSPTNLFDHHPEAFNLSAPYGMRLGKTISDINGELHYKFQQTYLDIPIYGSYYTIHQNREGEISGNGKIVTAEQINQTGLLNEDDALTKLLDHIGASKYYWEDSTKEAKVKQKQSDPLATYFPKAEKEFFYNSKNMSLRLCYTYHVYCVEGGRSGKYYVDIADGQILKFLPAEHNCESTSFISNFYGTQFVSTTDAGDNYELEDDCHNSLYGVYDATNDDDIFTDPGNTWTTDWQRSAATTLWGVKKSFLAYLYEFDRNGHDDDDGDIDIYQGVYFESGGNNNASFHYDYFGDDEINIGIGNSSDVTDDYNALDIVGHEFTHGVDAYTSDLEYEGESGALDESFADIFGEWIEFDVMESNDWFLGWDKLSSNGNCHNPLRYFIDPGAQDVDLGGGCTKNFDQPNTYRGTNWYEINGCDPDGETDNCGVHTNSGVQNQMFYLLVEGGSGWNDGNTCHASNGQGYSWDVQGIGMEDAIHIAYYARTVILGPTSDYADAREAWVQAATVLFGLCSNQAIQTGKAWFAVGMHPPSVSDEIICNVVLGNSTYTLKTPGRIKTGDGCFVIINDGGSLATFSAGINVVLKPGFHAVYGSRFRAIDTECEFARY